MKKKERRVRKWEAVVMHLRAFEATGLGEENAEHALSWALKWPNKRSRSETALGSTVVRVIKKCIASGAKASPRERVISAWTLADMVEREARLRVVASVQRKALLDNWTSGVVERAIRDGLADIMKALGAK